MHLIFPIIQFPFLPFISLLFFHFMQYFTDNPRDLTKVYAVTVPKDTDNTDMIVITSVTVPFSAEEYEQIFTKRF